MIIATGGAGFIGSNIIKALNKAARRDILLGDNLKDGRKFANLADLDIADYRDKEDFLISIRRGEQPRQPVDAVFHQGACSATTEWNGKYIMENNYQYSKELLHYCLADKIPIIYASSYRSPGL